MPPAANTTGGQVQTLVLSDNPGISGNISDVRLPGSLRALLVANTGLGGAFPAGWMSSQGADFDCLLAYGTGLCGALDDSLPCSVTKLHHNTTLGRLAAVDSRECWRQIQHDVTKPPRLLPVAPTRCAGQQCDTGANLTTPGTCRPSASCPPVVSDQQVLLALKASMTDPLGQLSSWEGPNPCSRTAPWAGVQCSNDSLAVVGLNVSGFGLGGALPSWDGLKALQVRACVSAACMRRLVAA
jgi:hypothetical protein